MKIRASISAVIICFILFADQLIKYSVKTGMALYERIHVFDWFYIYFVENRGMAFGMDFVGTGILTVCRLAAVAVFSYVLVKCIRQRYPIGFIICLAMIIAGAFGNIIDNCFYGLIFTESRPATPFYSVAAEMVPFGQGYGTFLSGKVVDMFYFPLWTWPESIPLIGGQTFFGAVFNFADSAISVGAVAMLLFYYKRIAALTEGKQTEKQ